jgi:hypothetical protein
MRWRERRCCRPRSARLILARTFNPPIAMLQSKPLEVSRLVLVNILSVAEADIKSAPARYASSAVASPRLFTRLTVPNHCVGA